MFILLCVQKNKQKMKKFNLNVGPDTSMLIANTEGFINERLFFFLFLLPCLTLYSLKEGGLAAYECVCASV